MSVSGRVLVPWENVRASLTGVPGLRVEVFSGDDPVPDGDDLSDVVFFTTPYDQPHGLDPLPLLSGVRVVQTLTAGYEHLLGAISADVTLCNARGLHDASTAEHALALILAAQRELPRWTLAQEAGRWDHAHTRSLAGARVLIVGYGSIGAALDARLRACEAVVTRVASRPRPEQDVHGVADLDTLLPLADVVVLVTPLTPETKDLLDSRRLALLPDGALVVNVGRGPVLSTEALLPEVTSGRLRAALDVTDPEPLPADHPLWRCSSAAGPSVIITPHVAGGAAAFYPAAAAFIADQVRRFAAGDPLANIVAGPGSGHA